MSQQRCNISKSQAWKTIFCIDFLEYVKPALGVKWMFIIYTFFPVLFMMGSLDSAGSAEVVKYVIAAYAGFYVLNGGVTYVANIVAGIRASSWEQWVSTWPNFVFARLGGRVVGALAVGLANIVPLTAYVVYRYGISVLIAVFVVVFFGGMLYSLWGIIAGLFLKPEAVSQVTGAINMGLLFACYSFTSVTNPVWVAIYEWLPPIILSQLGMKLTMWPAIRFVIWLVVSAVLVRVLWSKRMRSSTLTR